MGGAAARGAPMRALGGPRTHTPDQVIHEYDPWFNYRSTKFLASEGPYSFLNWFDDRSWYPLGRIVGGTIYPGLMATAAFMHWVLNVFNISVNVRNMCVFTAPIFAANTAIAVYLMTKEVRGSAVWDGRPPFCGVTSVRAGHAARQYWPARGCVRGHRAELHLAVCWRLVRQ